MRIIVGNGQDLIDQLMALIGPPCDDCPACRERLLLEAAELDRTIAEGQRLLAQFEQQRTEVGSKLMTLDANATVRRRQKTERIQKEHDAGRLARREGDSFDGGMSDAWQAGWIAEAEDGEAQEKGWRTDDGQQPAGYPDVTPDGVSMVNPGRAGG